MKNKNPETNYSIQNNLNLLAQNVQLLTKQVDIELSCLKSKMQDVPKKPATSYKTFTFIQKILTLAEQKPEVFSSQITISLLKEDTATLSNLQNLETDLEKLQDDLQDMIQIIRYDLYTKSKKIQDNLRKSESLN
ncbi:MAG: hypothetical protein NW226_17870 [Microscillaceae bacterium]|nr:hypothetical protein [Microscillaceae bacterium]